MVMAVATAMAMAMATAMSNAAHLRRLCAALVAITGGKGETANLRSLERHRSPIDLQHCATRSIQ